MSLNDFVVPLQLQKESDNPNFIGLFSFRSLWGQILLIWLHLLFQKGVIENGFRVLRCETSKEKSRVWKECREFSESG